MKDNPAYSNTSSMIAEATIRKVKRIFPPGLQAQAIREVVCLMLTTIDSSYLVDLRKNVEDIKEQMEDKGDKLSNIN